MEPENFLISLLTNFHFYNLLDWQNVQGALFLVGAKVIHPKYSKHWIVTAVIYWNIVKIMGYFSYF